MYLCVFKLWWKEYLLSEASMLLANLPLWNEVRQCIHDKQTYPKVLILHKCFLLATQLFRLLDKYRPESKQQKKARLKARAEERAAGKDDKPTKRPPVVRSGINSVTSLVEQKKAQLVVIAHDVDPLEVSLIIWTSANFDLWFYPAALCYLCINIPNVNFDQVAILTITQYCCFLSSRDK